MTRSVRRVEAACSSDDKSSISSGPQLPHFNEITDAPAPIQQAAKAVVRIHTAGQYGSGAFISPTGLLLTNNHVLGDTVCPIEGCYLNLDLSYQRGHAKATPVLLFAVPQAVSVGLDMAVVQLYNGSPTGSEFSSPDYLPIDPQDANALLGSHVTIVGHPKSGLKKWTDGFVADVTGNWFQTTAYILPGDSGSPVLDDAGHIVGLIHRGPTSEDLFSDNGVNIYSIGSASGPLSAAMSDPLPNTMPSVAVPTTLDAFLARNQVYLNARAATVNIVGTNTNALTALGQACDTALARNDFQSPGDLDAALAPCYDAHTWIECRSDETASPYGTLCPASADILSWYTRNQKINELWVAMNGALSYYTVSFAAAELQYSRAAGAGAAALLQALGASNPTLDFTLAYYLAAFNIDTYQNQSIHDYIVNYSKVPYYELHALNIAYAATWLWGDGSMGKSDVIALLKQLLNDPKVSIGDQLGIEDWLYNQSAL